MNSIVSLNQQSLEEALQIKEWGKWAWEGNGKVYPLWIQQMKRAYPDPPKDSELIGSIDPDYAMTLDAAICALGRRNPNDKKTLIKHYVYRIPLSRLAQIEGKKRHTLREDVNAMLGFLYGMLSDKEMV